MNTSKKIKMYTSFIGKVLMAGFLLSCAGGDELKPLPTEPTTGTGDGKPTDKGWAFETTPLWADEFNTNGAPDAARWGYDLGGTGWGNNELQNYTNSQNNAGIANGVLTITARKENSGTNAYSSARLVTKGKGDFLYGRMEIKAKLPSGRGTWPAIWMLPTDNAYGQWPKSGEIDIMEHVGYDPMKVHFTIHTDSYNGAQGTQKGDFKNVATAFTEFHLYRVDWTPYALRGYIDDQKVFEYVNDGKGSSTWPFDKRFHLLLNVAVGGNWGGAQGVDDTVFPKAMEVDYVRVYKMIEK
ncbi:glycoside hydrolase family 16 protein [uncultured Mucilaginibacter sp.]|uniref:glycoside hydrolase family 16 protein n=1 Tax=uncultured Mucilaginibacter sp. TaxID=797541 RepID=UPI0025F4C11A|nr:glycoside hydrolase family 16 protein [uncultured Mucilaginibacter sp.]